MTKSYHLCYDKIGLLIDVINKWPVDWLIEGGKPYGSLHEAVQAIVDVPTSYLPMACPTPNEEGRCPGHEVPE